MRGKRADKRGAAGRGGGTVEGTRARVAPVRSFLVSPDPPIKPSRKVFPMHGSYESYAARDRGGRRDRWHDDSEF